MRVTDKQYYLADFAIDKCKIYADRIKNNLDALILVDGDEGFGKTTLSCSLAYYLAELTGRTFTIDNIFFDPKKFVEKLMNSREQILVWDEAALGGLASNWRNKHQQTLIQALMTCRSRNHIIFFNIPKFYRLASYFIADRPVGLFHVYPSNKEQTKRGTYCYYRKEWIEFMWHMWNSQRKKPYKNPKWFRKQLRGIFVDSMRRFIDMDKYEAIKEKETSELVSLYDGEKGNKKLLIMQYNLHKMNTMTREQKAKAFGVTPKAISEWGQIPTKYPEIFRENS